MGAVAPDHVYVADISAYQTGFNIEKAYQDGLGAAVCKVTEGGAPGGESWDVANKSFARDMYHRATDMGMLFGFYHYLRGGSGRDQCDYFLSEVARITGHGVSGHLVQLDYEADDASFQTALDFANRFRASTGNHPLFVYTARWYWTMARLGIDYQRGAEISPYLWSAPNAAGGGSYYPGVHQPHDSPLWAGYGPWGNLSVMQYTNAGHTGGLLNVDLNCFCQPMSELRKMAGIIDPPPPPPVVTPPPPIVITPPVTTIPPAQPPATPPSQGSPLHWRHSFMQAIEDIDAKLNRILEIVAHDGATVGEKIIHDVTGNNS